MITNICSFLFFLGILLDYISQHPFTQVWPCDCVLAHRTRREVTYLASYIPSVLAPLTHHQPVEWERNKVLFVRAISLPWLIHWQLINSVKVSYLTSLHLCSHLYNRATGLNEITYNFTYGLSFSLITVISSKHYKLGYHYLFLEAKLSVIKPLEDFERIMWICNTLGLKPVIMVSF